MYSPSSWVVSPAGLDQLVARDGDWAQLEFVSEPCGSYTLVGALTFSYQGTGAAAISEVSIARP